MLETITGETIASEVEMIRTSFKGAILIVEGGNDKNLFNQFIDDSLCYLIVAHGKENAISAISILNSEKKKGIVALVDSDYWRIDGIESDHKNLLVTDLNDIECMIFDSTALDKVVAEYCSKNKVEKIGDLRNYFIDRATTIGLLRLTSHRKRFNLVFESIDYKKFTDRDTLDIDVDLLVRHINQLTSNLMRKKNIISRNIPDMELIKYMEEQKELTKYHDKLKTCCGHDIIGIFAIGLRKLIGTVSSAVSDYENIGKLFRLAYGSVEFKATYLARSIVEWEINNKPFVILKLI